jgi:hypothetical protein
MPEHVIIPGALLLMSIGFAVGIANGISNAAVKLAARVVVFVPPVVAYARLRPPSFGATVSAQLSTSQWIGFLTAVAAALFYGQFLDAARKMPKGSAMSPETLGPGALEELAREAKERGEESPAEAAKKKGEGDDAHEGEDGEGAAGDAEQPATENG